VVVVPDRHGDGTNVLLLPCAGDFTFQYGPGSCAAPLSHATGLGLSVEVVHRDDLALDLDTPDDLHAAGLTAPNP
jgi:2-phospho-L-lactate guanylyltransferase